MLTLEKKIEESLHLLEPSIDPGEGIVNLLLEKARRNYVKYRLMDERFHHKYRIAFEMFKNSATMREPSFEVEQDFFDWDMAITGMTDMEEEVQKADRAVFSTSL